MERTLFTRKCTNWEWDQTGNPYLSNCLSDDSSDIQFIENRNGATLMISSHLHTNFKKYITKYAVHQDTYLHGIAKLSVPLGAFQQEPFEINQ